MTTSEIITAEELIDATAVSAGRPQVPPQRLFEAESIEERVEVVEERSWIKRGLNLVGLAWEWVFGLMSLVVGLAFLSTFPILQFVSLGYLLEVSGRVARTGRLRDGLIGVREAARLGSIVLGTWLMLWPLRLISDLWHSAWLIDRGSNATRFWRMFLVLATVMLVAHLLWAWFRGGRLRHFFWPAPVQFVRRVSQGGMYRAARDAVWDFVVGMRLPYYLWLGVRGFAGAVAWLSVPVLLLVAAFRLPEGPAALAGLIGSVLLAWVVLYLPFLQAQFAEQNRLVAMFDVAAIRRAFQRAPVAFWFSLMILLLFSLPLYLLKIEFLEREVAWLPSLAFVVFIAPARWLTGWAVSRARRRETPRFFLIRWLGRLGMLPVAFFYVFIVYLSRYTSWYGSWSLFEQHAFLLPVPFLGL